MLGGFVIALMKCNYVAFGSKTKMIDNKKNIIL